MKKSFVLFLLHFFGLGRPSDHQLINSQKHSQTQSLNFISFVICVILLQDEEAHRGERKELAMLWVTTQPLSIATFATLTACNERCKIAKSKNHAKKCHNAEVLDLGQIIAGVHYRRFRKTKKSNGKKRRNVSRLASCLLFTFLGPRLCTDVDGSGALYRAAPVTGVSFVCTGAVYSCNVNESTRIFLDSSNHYWIRNMKQRRFEFAFAGPMTAFYSGFKVFVTSLRFILNMWLSWLSCEAVKHNKSSNHVCAKFCIWGIYEVYSVYLHHFHTYDHVYVMYVMYVMYAYVHVKRGGCRLDVGKFVKVRLHHISLWSVRSGNRQESILPTKTISVL